LDHGSGETFRGRLLLLRGRIGLTQRELAGRLGVHVHSVQAWETGDSYPSAVSLQRLVAAALGAGGFAAGREAIEAAELWSAAVREAPRLRTPFDHAWFDGLLEAADERARGRAATEAVAGDAPDVTRLDRPLAFPGHVRPQPTRLIGRRRELDRIRQVLLNDDVRLVTLIGPAGVGKTRLAVEVAGEVAGQFAQSVCFIDLTLTRDPDLVPAALAHGIGLQDTEGGSLFERLSAYLRDRETLLILDNFERVLPAVSCLVELLGSCPAIKFLVTSREPLDLLWEHTILVPPLALPDLEHLPSLSELSQNPSVALYLQCSQAIDPEFSLTAGNARAVAALCVHLDGLPLALELAAARARLLSPQMILERLTDRFALLRWHARDLPPRQRTLRSAIGWSYDRLSEAEQRLFRHVGVFAGGFTLAAVEALEGRPPNGAADTPNVLDALTWLVDKSLVLAEPDAEDGVRYRLLESLRDFALEQLAAHGEEAAARQTHAACFSELAAQGERELKGAEQDRWFRRLERDHENLRAALRWWADHGEGEHALRLAASLGYFWWTRGYLAEARRHLQEALARAPGAEPSLRAKALNTLAINLLSQGEQEHARAILEETLALARVIQDRGSIAQSLADLGLLAQRRGEWAESTRLLNDARACWHENGDVAGSTYALVHVGITSLFGGDADGAEQSLTQAEAAYRAMGDVRNMLQTRAWLGYIAGARGDLVRASASLRPSIEWSLPGRDPRLLYHCTTLVLWLTPDEAAPEQAARLVGAHEALRDTTGFSRSAWMQSRSTGLVGILRARLTPEAFEAERAAGRSLSFSQMADLALQVLEICVHAADTTERGTH
jgi:non-specific serine/threonine protein kinase